MNSLKFVLQVYPHAAAQHLKAISRAAGIQGKDHWRIHDGHEQIAVTIGRGDTADAAWLDAARNIAGLCPTPRLVKILAVQGRRFAARG